MPTLISNSVEETEKIGEGFSEFLKGTEVIALYGDLGAGKTAFTRGLAGGLGVKDSVSSPTFSIVNEYRGIYPIYHFDMYRIDSWDDLYSVGFFDYIGNGIVIIEWSENIQGALPEDCIRIEINPGESENSRIIVIEGE